MKRSLSLRGHRTSIALEPEFWAVIERAAKQQGHSLAGFIASLDDKRTAAKSRQGLASYLRVWALVWAQEQGG